MFADDDWNAPPTIKPRTSVSALPSTSREDRKAQHDIVKSTISPAHRGNSRPAGAGITEPPPRLRQSPRRPSKPTSDVVEPTEPDIVSAARRHSGIFDGDEKLFSRLLDDLDNINTSSASAHRRRKATQIFSSWLFSPAAQRTDSTPTEPQLTRRFTGDFSDFDVSTYEDDVATPQASPKVLSPLPSKVSKLSREEASRRSVDGGVMRLKCEVTRRSSDGNIDQSRLVQCAPQVINEDDSDSGYHTGNSVILGAACRKLQSSPEHAKIVAASPERIASAQGKIAASSPERFPSVREVLKRRIEAFNSNSDISHGLVIEQPQDDETFCGAVRVHVNLIRPINMCVGVPPPSRFDDVEVNDVQYTSFYLPQDTTTVIHVSSTMAAPEVIKTLLSKFKITDSPRKFALYERHRHGDTPATMRKLGDEELPLPLLLNWADGGIDNLNCFRFVLQENDAGEIQWDEFSLPELDKFLSVLKREEEEYVDQVKNKYLALKIQMQKRLGELTIKEKRPPVSV